MNDLRQRLTRRTVVAGAGAAGVLTAAAVALATGTRHPVVPAEPAPTPEPRFDAGYRESEHVLRYYQTTRI